MNTNLHSLNEHFAIPGHVSFHRGPGDLILAVVNNSHAAAAITLEGAHVMTYTPHGSLPVLWESPCAAYEISNAMRGGFPVCWPWFAEHDSQPTILPIHGFARMGLYSLSATRAMPDGSTELRMVLKDNEDTRALWPFAFELELLVSVGRSLRVEWSARNPGDQPYHYTGALHPYFLVSDVNTISIRGLDGVDYLDKVEDFRCKTQLGDIEFESEVDRVYLNTSGDVTIEDPGYRRALRIRKIGSNTTVVWNPDYTAAEMPDVGAGNHKTFVCVEAANAGGEVVTVGLGDERRLGMEIEILPQVEM